MGTITVMWEKTIPLEVEYEYEPEQKATSDSPGCAESLHVIEAKLPNGSDLFWYLGDNGMAAIESLTREALEGKVQDSEAERALDSLMGRQDWEHFFSHGRRVVG